MWPSRGTDVSQRDPTREIHLTGGTCELGYSVWPLLGLGRHRWLEDCYMRQKHCLASQHPLVATERAAHLTRWHWLIWF
jgi:hypothetical protein